MARPSNKAGTRVALYLRRSTDVHQEESLDTQRRGASEYCAARGWVIVEEFVDDAISRAEFKKRPALALLQIHAARKLFDLVVMRDESRLGGDMMRTGLVIQDLADAGVGIVHYYTDELVSVEGAVDRFLVAARNFSSEMEREKLSARVYEHLMNKAKDGRPAGGISYGYVITDKQYAVKEPEASTVRRIFARYAAGAGQRAIAHELNDERVPSPRAGKRGTGSWAPSSIRAILLNSRYVGEGKYNQTRKLYRGGTKVRERRPDGDHVTYACPAIVDRVTWDAVAARFARNPKWSSPTHSGAKPRYMLTGISKCGDCGGPMTVSKQLYKRVTSQVYVCGWRKNRGTSVCQSTMVEPVEAVDARVVAALRELITPDLVSDVIRQVREIHAELQAAVPAETQTLRAEIEKLRREIARLTAAIASTDDPPGALMTAVSDRDKRLRQAEIELAQTTATSTSIDAALEGLELEARRRVRDLDTKFNLPETARATVVALFGGERLRFETADGRFHVLGSVGVSGLLRPETAPADCVASPMGFDTVGLALAAAEPLRLPFAA